VCSSVSVHFNHNNCSIRIGVRVLHCIIRIELCLSLIYRVWFIHV
jgi:hypothetical protein